MGFEGLFYVDSVGLSGGLALFWRRNNTARLLSFSKNHVDIEVTMTGLGEWRMTGFYGFPERGRRSASWDLLRTLADRSTLPWVVLGDFNDLLFQYEKRGGNPHPESLLRGFGEVVDDCGLIQLPMRGYQFTWERGRGTEEWMEERLDKVLARADWCNSLPEASVTNILTRNSDHSALFLGVKGSARIVGGTARRFRFEMAWAYYEGCRQQVEVAWHEGRSAGLLGCLQHCGNKLLNWGGDHFHKFGDKIKNMRREQALLKGRLDPTSLQKYQQLETMLCQLEAQEEAFWKQRAKQHWLRGADANTKFFHMYASARKKKNTLNRLRNDSGIWVEHEDLNVVVLNYFRNIFTSNASASSMDDFTASVIPRVSQDHNNSLLRPFEVEEVKVALSSMFPDKALGPDGMNPGFYQQFWDVVGSDVSSFILHCLNTCSFPSGLNDTNVVFIPKKKCPEMVSDLRPIALCNVVYKIMAKMVANRMKPLLGEIISDSQSAFIPNRLITDNILIAAEVGHFLNRKRCGAVGWGALKLDMAKAYDRMEWTFLRRMLIALGFAEAWVNLVMLCVTTVSYNFLVNGDIVGQQAEARGSFHGCRVTRGAPPVSHLFFADDSLLFFKANAEEAGVIKQCLIEYEGMSGQAVNFHKSSICFSRNTSEVHREEVAVVLGVSQAPNFGKYLGLPSFIGREKRAVFSYIEDKIRQRIGSWNKKLISQGHEQVLVGFWNERGIHWKAWDKLCIPKKYGGLGFKDLRAFNLAMLGKQAWRFLTRPQSLVARVYKARYFPKSSFVDAALGSNPSFCWRSIMAAHELVCAGVQRRIGNGRTTLIWGHPWLPDDPSPMVHTPMPAVLNGSVVSGLINPDSGTWDLSILHDIFTPNDIDRILTIPISPHHEDSWFWLGDPKGCYTVKEGYRSVIGEVVSTPGTFDSWLHLWKIKCPAKWKMFIWKALSNVLPTTTNLIIKRVEVDPSCPMCGILHEDVMHSLVLCDYSRLVWNESSLHVPSVIDVDFIGWFQNAMTMLNKENMFVLVAVLYHIWKARNHAVWDAYLPAPGRVWRMATTSATAWKQVHGAQAPLQPPIVAATATHATQSSQQQLHAAVDHPLPNDGLPRCFFDASYCPRTRSATVGAMLVTNDSQFIAAFCAPLPPCFSPLMAESLACKEALSWLKNRESTSVRVYTDCSTVKDLLYSVNPSLFSYVSYSVDASKALMSSFVYCSVDLIPRTHNQGAHTLATEALAQGAPLFWDSVLPNSIAHLF
ncbi:uncharacterized protein LOC116023707 [Ipomoea triloba]|uniref:uncharacterized protein LOC116023707 n=1 Tax=Ipomoea triloba TaxID=35885 RepID=UPI00125D28CF|nr:uncharacterized protein LOC116023707 [Ipomoea triloba]